MPDCELCGGGIEAPPYYFELEYPPDGGRDPGHVGLNLCEECAGAIATNELVDGAVVAETDAATAGVEGGAP
jgi:hypothetical protein